MVVRPGTWMVPTLLVAVLMLTPGVQAACVPVSETATLYVPTVTSLAPQNYVHTVQGVVFYRVLVDPDHKTFTLDNGPGTTTSTVCTLSGCALFPDFNVAWYVEGTTFDSRIAIHNVQGPDSGNVPAGADYALIFMSYGPDTGTSDGTAGATFEFDLAC